MKKIVLSVFLSLYWTVSALAAFPVSELANPSPVDMVGMDMATDAAKSSVKRGGVAGGAVIVVDGRVKATGIPGGGKSAEENAVIESGLKSLAGASVYTVNQPSVPVYVKLSDLGVASICFVNGSDAVIAAGLEPASAYDESLADGKSALAPLKSMSFPEAQRLLRK